MYQTSCAFTFFQLIVCAFCTFCISPRFMWWRRWLRHCPTSGKFAGSIPDGVYYFSLTYSFWMYYGLEIDSTSNVNEYQEYSLRAKACRCVGLTPLLHPCADCLEIWLTQPRGITQSTSRPVMGLLYLLQSMMD